MMHWINHRVRSVVGGLSRLAAVCLVANLASASVAVPVRADDKGSDSKPKSISKGDKPTSGSKSEKPTSKVGISADREAAALNFARSNHPELASLLEGLKKNAPAEYQAGLTELDRAVERLAKLKEKSVERYEVELADWKITSRIRLLAARLTMSEDPTIEVELRSALRERLEMRVAAQRTERDRLQARIDKLNQSIDESSATAEVIVDKQFAELKKTLPAKPTGKGKPKKPTANTADSQGEKK